MTDKTKELLEIALDAIWVEYGNGYRTECERLIAEMQIALEKETEKRILNHE